MKTRSQPPLLVQVQIAMSRWAVLQNVPTWISEMKLWARIWRKYRNQKWRQNGGKIKSKPRSTTPQDIFAFIASNSSWHSRICWVTTVLKKSILNLWVRKFGKAFYQPDTAWTTGVSMSSFILCDIIIIINICNIFCTSSNVQEFSEGWRGDEVDGIIWWL